MKKLFIVALSAGALYLLYTAYKKSQEEKEKEVKPQDVAEMPTKEPPFVCPEGEVLCEGKENKCYNPAAKYIVNPCS